MGKKSGRGKDKKMKLKVESAKIAASQAIVQAANSMEDPLVELQPFKKFERNGLSLTIHCYKVANMDTETVDFAFQLTKDNMEALYEDSDWGWNDKQKKTEMTEEDAWYLIARDANDKPVAIVHFRFDLDEDIEVLYCYEIQLTKPVRRKGLGKFLMQILELMAHKTQMKKVMVTVFTNNVDARKFFKEVLKYTVDETSPEETMVEAMFDEDGYTYEILSKKIVPRKPLKPTQSNGQQSTQSIAAK